jgi:hypothetical protein
MTQLYIDGIGVWGGGLFGWPEARSVLRGETSLQGENRPMPAAALLPAAERRRSPSTVRLALHVAEEACAMAKISAAQLPSVFTSAQGDTEITDYMCRELARPEAAISPTKFHNSVHNAASGYWTIATGCMQSSNAVSGYLDSFACGLLEAAAIAAGEHTPSLLVAYDIAAPGPLSSVCPVTVSLGIALVLNVVATSQSLARLSFRVPNASMEAAGAAAHGKAGDALPGFLHPLRMANPIARALPLLHAIATRTHCRLEESSATWPFPLDVEPWN